MRQFQQKRPLINSYQEVEKSNYTNAEAVTKEMAIVSDQEVVVNSFVNAVKKIIFYVFN